jgi:G:T-mismatch repair DNA endonuclease (very short patch repair protein)
MIALTRASNSCKRQTCPVVRERERERESAAHQQTRNCDSDKDLVVSPKWVLYSKTDWLTVGRNISLRLRLRMQVSPKWEVQTKMEPAVVQSRIERDQTIISELSKFGWRVIVSCNWLWLRVIVKKVSVNPITQSENPLLLLTHP